MKTSEIKELSTADLQDRLGMMQKEYHQLKINHAVTPLDNPAKITKLRKDIARVQTELRARQLQPSK